MGVASSLGTKLGISQNSLKLSDRFQRAAVRGGVGTAFNVVTQNLDMKQAAIQGVGNVAANALGAFAANEIAFLNMNGGLDYFSHKFLHTVLGAAVGAASNLNDPLTGAGGGAIGALGAEVIAGALPDTIPHQTRANIGVILAASTALVADQDVNGAGLAAQNAMENNFLFTASLLAVVGTEKGRGLISDMAEVAEESVVNPSTQALETKIEFLEKAQKITIEHCSREILANNLLLKDPNLTSVERHNLHMQNNNHIEAMANAYQLPINVLEASLAGLTFVSSAGNVLRGLKGLGSGIKLARGVNEALDVEQKVVKGVRQLESVSFQGARGFQPKAAANINSVNSAAGDLAGIKNASEKTQKFYGTYFKYHPELPPYQGRFSGYGDLTNQRDIDKALKMRDRNHHMNKKGFGPALHDKVALKPEAIRGREQINIDKAGGAQSQGGTSSNAINGVRNNHPKKEEFLKVAKEIFGVKE